MHSQHILFVAEIEPEAKTSAHIVLPPPKVEPLHEVFEKALLEGTSRTTGAALRYPL